MTLVAKLHLQQLYCKLCQSLNFKLQHMTGWQRSSQPNCCSFYVLSCLLSWISRYCNTSKFFQRHVIVQWLLWMAVATTNPVILSSVYTSQIKYVWYIASHSKPIIVLWYLKSTVERKWFIVINKWPVICSVLQLVGGCPAAGLRAKMWLSKTKTGWSLFTFPPGFGLTSIEDNRVCQAHCKDTK